MARVKRGVISHRKRERLLKHTKGFRWGRRSKERLAREALLHAGAHAFVGRKHKKRNFRRQWQVAINTAARTHDLSYNRLISGLKKKNVAIDRKVLAELARTKPDVFTRLAEIAK